MNIAKMWRRMGMHSMNSRLNSRKERWFGDVSMKMMVRIEWIFPLPWLNRKYIKGLCRASFVLVRWAFHICGLEADSKFNQAHLVRFFFLSISVNFFIQFGLTNFTTVLVMNMSMQVALFIQFGLGEVNVKGTRRRYIQRVSFVSYLYLLFENSDTVSGVKNDSKSGYAQPSGEVRVHLKKGEHLLKFIDYVASREFRWEKRLWKDVWISTGFTSTISGEKKRHSNLNLFRRLWNSFLTLFSIGNCYSKLKIRSNCCLRSRDALSFDDIMVGVLMRGEWRTFSHVCSFSFYYLFYCISLTRVLFIECYTLSSCSSLPISSSSRHIESISRWEKRGTRVR